MSVELITTLYQIKQANKLAKNAKKYGKRSLKNYELSY
jgi:hypothetical protein